MGLAESKKPCRGRIAAHCKYLNLTDKDAREPIIIETYLSAIETSGK
jgi:hypothetical protein